MYPSKLFQPITIGNLTLQHRVVLAPLTRARATADHVPPALAIEYYAQRASIPGSLLISEANCVSEKSGLAHFPGLYTEAQIAGWKKLWALGDVLESESESSKTDKPQKVPIPLSEVKEYVNLFATAAHNAVHLAGFDGVELHGANGYLVDQFLQSVSNTRTDEYGGSVENRTRFAREIVDAIVNVVGEEKTAIRVSPWSRFQGMREPDPIEVFSYLINRLREDHPDLAYIHAIEPRVHNFQDVIHVPAGESNDFIRRIWLDRSDSKRRLISAGGYTRKTAIETADRNTFGGNELIAFGRYFIPNPDLPRRLAEDIALTPGDRSLYIVPGSTERQGYTSYSPASSL